MPSRRSRPDERNHSLISDEDDGDLALILEILRRAKLTIWAADGPEDDFGVCYWSRGAERVYGYSREEAVGNNYIDLFVNPSEREQAIADHVRMVAEDEEYEWDWAADDVAKDGAVHTMLTNCFPVLDPRRNKWVLAELGVDISKKEQASAKLRKLQAESVIKEAKASNLRWMGAVASLYSTTGRLSSPDADGVGAATRAAAVAVRRVVEGNPLVRVWLTAPTGAILADGSDDLDGRPVIEEASALALLEQQADHREAMFLDSHDRDTLPAPSRFRGKGRAAAVIPIEFGLKLRGMLVLHFRENRRISESERSALAYLGMHIGVVLAMEEQWAELQRWRESESARIKVQAVQRFLRLVFHRVGGSAYVVGEELRRLEEMLASADVSDEMMSLVRRIRDRSDLIEAALEDFRSERDHVHELRSLCLHELCLARTVDIDHTHPTVEVELHVPDDIYVETSEFLLAEALSNLITNAAEEFLANRDGGGVIRLSAVVVNDDVVLSVEDSGRGIPASWQEDIWRPGNSTKGSGHGYGLAYAKEAVQLAGGDLLLREEPSGDLGGAHFTVHLKATAGN